jgi:hypothetical protein
VENCLKKGDPNLLVFDSDAVLARADKHGDLFGPVLKLKQKMPPLTELQNFQDGIVPKVARTISTSRQKTSPRSTATKPKSRPAAKKRAPARKRG